jgi:cellulose biosynthesis protein BcsQ
MNKSLYFSHDYTASDDVKMLFLRQSLGMEGVGIFWYMIERLAQSGGKLPTKIIPVLAMQMQIDIKKVNEVLNNFELFEIIDDVFSSNRLNETILLRKTLQDAGQRGAAKRWDKPPTQTKIILP